MPSVLYLTPHSLNHISFSQGKSPGQSVLRNANHETQNDSSSQTLSTWAPHPTHSSSITSKRLLWIKILNWEGLTSPKLCSHAPCGIQVFCCRVGKQGSGKSGSYCTLMGWIRVLLPPWWSSLDQVRGWPIPAGRTSPRELELPSISAPRPSGSRPRFPAGPWAHTQCSHRAHSGTRTLTPSGGHLWTAPSSLP